LAIKTTLEQLEEVQAAITKVMSGQDMSISDKRLQRAKLDSLTARESILLARYKAETGTGGIAINQGILRRD
jgi:hypothetical protein